MAVILDDNGSSSALTFSSGHRAYVCCGVVGLKADGELKVFNGYDGDLGEMSGDKVTPEDMVELADQMIERWRAVRAKAAAGKYL